VTSPAEKPSRKGKAKTAPVEAPVKPPEKPALEGLTQDDAARKAGCAQSTVWRAIARGDIVTLPNGRVPESEIEKLIALRKQDQESADAVADLKQRLLAAETSEREAKAKLKILELEREAGKYVELEVVARDAADTRERILAVLRAIPQRTAMALECACTRAAVVEKTISDEVERAIGELRKSAFAGDGA
jgi:muconolactone delta-isomerase